MNWSGGKDSSFCLQKILRSNNHVITTLLTTVNRQFNRISQHGVRVELLEKQSINIGIPVKKVYLDDVPTMESYNRIINEVLTGLSKDGVTVSIFGDIFLEDLRQYREKQLAKAGYKAVFPLWKMDTDRLAREFIEEGFKAVVVCVDERHLNKQFSGRPYDLSFLNDLPEGVDPCGENGEFHTFVYDGPIFTKPVSFSMGETVYRTYTPPKRDDEPDEYECGTSDEKTHPETGFWYLDLIPV